VVVLSLHNIYRVPSLLTKKTKRPHPAATRTVVPDGDFVILFGVLRNFRRLGGQTITAGHPLISPSGTCPYVLLPPESDGLSPSTQHLPLSIVTANGLLLWTTLSLGNASSLLKCDSPVNGSRIITASPLDTLTCFQTSNTSPLDESKVGDIE